MRHSIYTHDTNGFSNAMYPKVYPMLRGLSLCGIMQGMTEQENAPQGATSAPNGLLDAPPAKVIDHALAAKMLIRQGKPWRECALAAGYSESVALRGLRQVMAESSSLTDA